MSNRNRSTSRRSRIEDIEMLIALRNAIYDCQIAINQSLAVIDATVEAIKLFDRLQHPRPPDAGDEHQIGPTSSASREITEE
jgi:hypothetical protein